jgi:hypothetical protein
MRMARMSARSRADAREGRRRGRGTGMGFAAWARSRGQRWEGPPPPAWQPGRSGIARNGAGLVGRVPGMHAPERGHGVLGTALPGRDVAMRGIG